MYVNISECPSCGGTLKFHNGFIECPYCGKTILELIEAKVDDKFDIMSPQEFADHVRSNWKTYYISTGTEVEPRIEEFNIDILVTNKLIHDAKSYLQQGKFWKVIDTLSEVTDNNFAVNRMRFLASCEKKSEGEFLIDEYDFNSNPYYRALINSADEASAATYRAIAKQCNENHRIRTEIESGMNKLLDHKMYEEALTFANMMCKKYPYTARSWAYRLMAKKGINQFYKGNIELSNMDQCLDHDKVIYELFGSKEHELVRKKEEQSKVNGLGIISAIILYIIESVCIAIVTPIFNDPKAGVLKLLLGIIVCIIGFVIPVITGSVLIVNIYWLWKSLIYYFIVRSNKKYLSKKDRKVSNPIFAVTGCIMLIYIFIYSVQKVSFFWYGK